MSQNSKLKYLTEDKYTLSDIFLKHHELWLMVPIVIYLLTPIVHIITFSILYKDPEEWSLKDYAHYFENFEMVGDYYKAIIHYAFFIATLFTIVAIITFIIYSTKTRYKMISADSVTLFFFIAYALLIIISTIVNKTNKQFILGETLRAEGVIQVLGYLFIFYLCGSLIKRNNYKKFLIWFFLATGVVIAAITIINKYFIDIKIIRNEYVCGIFYTHNFYAYYLTVTIMLCAGVTALGEGRIKRIAAFLIMCLNTFVLAINDSLGPFLAAIVAFVFLFVAVTYKKKKFSFTVLGLFAVFMGIVFVTGLFTPSFFSEFVRLGKDVKSIVTDSENAGNAGTDRWTLWTHTWQYIKEKPFIGWGLEGTAERLGTETHADKAHNEYLENMAYYGIPAGLMYLFGLMAVYIKALIKRKSIDNTTIICLAGALAYIGSALVGNSFIFTAPFFFIFLGLANNTTGQYPPYSEEVKETETTLSDEETKATDDAAEIDTELKSAETEAETIECETETPAESEETAGVAK